METPLQRIFVTSPDSVQLLIPSAQAQPLPIGSVVAVRAAQNGDGALGILLQGQFLEAHLPQNIPLGTHFSAEVLANQDALLLKILSQELPSEVPTHQSSFTLAEALRTVLPEETVRDLKSAISPPRSDGGSAPQVPSQHSSESEDIALVHRLLQSELPVDSTLDQPEMLNKALQSLAPEKLIQTLSEARRSLERLGQQTVRESLRDLARGVEENTRQLSTLTELGFSLPSNSSPTPSPTQSQNAVALARYTQATFDLQSPSHVKEAHNSPLAILLRTLDSASIETTTELTPQEHQVVETLRKLTTNLHMAKASGASSTELQQLLSEGAKELETLRQGYESAPSDRGAQTLANLESTARAQVALNDLNPLLRSLGEPALMLVPLFLHGTLKRWHMRVEQKDPQARREGNAKREQFIHLELILDLKQIGQIEVILAHSESQIFCHFLVDDIAPRELLEPLLKQLDASLSSLGYTKINLSVSTGEIDSTPPSWLAELTQSQIQA